MELNSGGPAFPTKWAEGDVTPGMSLRDWFAAHAMEAMLTSRSVFDGASIAEKAYRMADSMLAEGKKQAT